MTDDVFESLESLTESQLAKVTKSYIEAGR